MKQVDIIFNEPLDSIIGPVQTVKRLVKNNPYFNDNGYNLTPFTMDNLHTSGNTILKIKKRRNTIIKTLKSIARYFALHSRMYAKWRLFLVYKNTADFIEGYKKLNRRPDIVVFHSIFDCYEYLKGDITGDEKIALFTHSDGFIYQQFLSYFPQLKGTKYENRLINEANYVFNNITIKPYIAEIEEKNLLAQFPQLLGKTCPVINGIDDLSEEEIEIAEDIKQNQSLPIKYRFVCVGSINGRKGHKTVIDALSHINKNILDNIIVYFVGDGPERQSLEILVKEKKLDQIVIFEGSVKNKEVYKNLAKANGFILMSKNEGLPIALLEGMRSGLALISTNVSGIPELIEDGINGKLLEPTVEDLVTFLNNLENYNLDEMGQKSRVLFEKKYVFTRVRQDYLKMLNKAFANNP